MAADHVQPAHASSYQQRINERSGFDVEEQGEIHHRREASTNAATPHQSGHRVTSFLSTHRDKLAAVLELEDFQIIEVWRAAACEFVATLVMVFVGTLCTISSLETGFQHPTVAIAVFQAVTLALCIWAAAPLSGGHVNPTITWAEMLTGHITPVRALLYIAAQALGSITASLSVRTVVGKTTALKYMLGGCYLHQAAGAAQGLEPGRAFLLETMLSFFVLFIAYAVALDPQRLPTTGPRLAPFLIGGLVGLCIFAGGTLVPGYPGAGINPARCLGPAVALGGSLWTNHWVFWLGPAVAGVAMALMYTIAVPPSHLQVHIERRRKTS